MKQSLKTRILTHLRKENVWIHKGKIETMAKNGSFGKPNKKAVGYLGETSGRKLRDLVIEGSAEKHPDKQGYYRATAPKVITTYRVEGKLVHVDKNYK